MIGRILDGLLGPRNGRLLSRRIAETAWPHRWGQLAAGLLMLSSRAWSPLSPC